MTNQPENPRTWMEEWVRSESFWKDVASRSFAGVVVLIVSGLFAGMIGWAVSDSVRPIFAAAAVGFALLLAALAVIAFVFRTWLWASRSGKSYSIGLLVLAIAVTLVTIWALLGPGLVLIDWVFELNQ
ncbi:cation transport ATPase [Leifsonia sp. AK011]|uniref:hypothetical protein n=1 Tax=Leifsonia sp. AK011 TaxID=2723075 RepID=UPI0015C7363C|nr:hypothetical protein [Leifsonia sp. AK011]NYF10912.1 cation transport ATPase [Leifsonia sp. AK011]